LATNILRVGTKLMFPHPFRVVGGGGGREVGCRVSWMGRVAEVVRRGSSCVAKETEEAR
jgi:hypothetical protein